MKKIECPKCNHRFVLQQVKRRQCSKCKRWKSIKNFYDSRSTCKRCLGYQGRIYQPSTKRKDGKKQCRKCKQWQEETEFWKSPTTEDGLQSWCKKCNREYNTSYQRKHRKVKKADNDKQK